MACIATKWHWIWAELKCEPVCLSNSTVWFWYEIQSVWKNANNFCFSCDVQPGISIRSGYAMIATPTLHPNAYIPYPCAMRKPWLRLNSLLICMLFSLSLSLSCSILSKWQWYWLWSTCAQLILNTRSKTISHIVVWNDTEGVSFQFHRNR